MKISDYSPTPGLLQNTETAGQAAKNAAALPNQAPAPAPEGKSPVEGDTVMLSDRSRLIAKAQDAVARTPDVRAERVSELKAQVASGAYNVKGGLVAGALLRSHLQEIA